MHATTFSVSDVKPGASPMDALPREASLRSLLRGRPIEAVSPPGARPLVKCTDAHPLAEAAFHAFFEHHPLVLSPDAIWFCLAQGFAHHLARNAERLRARFVQHQGKATLTVVRPDFRLGQPNPWPEAFAAFSDQIAAHVGKLRDLVVADFSTTSPVERAASEVALMDAFQPYFEYEMLIGCGIPAITLLGTPDDWRSVRRRAAMLSEFDLAPWTDALLPVLDEIVRASEGHADRAFWRSFFRYQSGSGAAELTGWINVLFPYLREFSGSDDTGKLRPNPYLSCWEQAFKVAEAREGWLRWNECEGPCLREMPSGLASAPVKVVDMADGSEHALRFVAGMLGVTQDPESLALTPEFGWAVVHER